jgi:hypothetical protein
VPDVHAAASANVVRRTLIRVSTHPEWFAWIGLALALLFLFIRLGFADDRALDMWITSDSLYPVNVFTDVLQDGYSLSGWRFSIAPCWFPDLIATGIFWLVSRDVIVGTLLAGFVQIALIVPAFHIIGKAIGIRNIRLQDTLLLTAGILITLYVALHPGAYYPKLYMFFLPQTHVGSMLSVLYGWGIALWMIRKELDKSRPAAWLIVVYAGLCLLAGMSNLLFAAHMLAPLTATLAILSFFKLIAVRQCWVPVVCGWGAAGAGALLNRVLFNVTDVTSQSDLSPERVLVSLDVFMRGFVGHVLTGDVVHIGAIVWGAVCTGYIVWLLRHMAIEGCSRVSRLQILMAAFFLLSLISTLCSVAAIVLGGSNGLAVFKDYVWSMHYLHQAFFLPFFGVPAVLAWILEYSRSYRAVRVLNWAAATGVLVLVLVYLVPSQWPATPIYSYRPALVRFIDAIASAKGLRYGYAGYWQARLITLLSRSGVRSYAVHGSMSPFLWVSNEEWYRQSYEDRSRPPKTDFVVLDDPLFKLSREAAVQKFGEPVSELRVQGTRVLVYAGTK